MDFLPDAARWSWMAWDAWRAGSADAAGLARRQQARLAGLVRHARVASPYYRRLYRDLPPHVADAALLPPVRKPELMDSFDEWVTDPDVTLASLRRDFLSDTSLVGLPYLGRYLVFTTSGTTGEPAVLLHDARSLALLGLVSRIRTRRTVAVPSVLRPMLRGGSRTAALFATGGHFGGVVLAEYSRRRSFLLTGRVRVFSVQRPVAELVEELDEFRPVMLSGYPSAVALLAGEQRAGRLHIGPALAMVAGEALTAAMRAEIEAAFGCRILRTYAASEAPALAVECPVGALHVNADWYLLEPVDEDHRVVPPGQTSHTALVTNLANRVQPVIRYDLGDRVTLSPDPCRCGSALPVVTVEGRAGDLLRFASPAGGTVAVLPLALGTVVEETPGVRRFQAVRTGPAAMTIHLDFQPGADPEQTRRAVDDALAAFLAEQGAAPVTITHDPAPPAVDPRSGKFRQVRSD